MMELPPQFSAVLPAHILVMDDVGPILDLLREILEEEGYRVSTSQERLDLPQIRALRPDAILQEICLAGSHALDDQYLATVRDDPALAPIPIILCTTCTRVVQDEVMAEQLRQLRVRVVRKPFAIDELLKVLAASLTTARRECAGNFPVGSTR